jgi:predicted Zn-dependent protease
MSYQYQDPYQEQRQPPSRRMSAFKVRLIIAGVIVLISLISFWARQERNPTTGELQRVGGLSIEDEIAIGLQAAPEMIVQHHGESRDIQGRRKVETIAAKLLNSLYQRVQGAGGEIPYQFQVHLLADPQTVNAFALPGGQVFITEALYQNLQNEAQLAGVLGHEIGHVLERHGAQRIAKDQLLQGIVGAAGVAGGSPDTAQIAQVVAQLTQMKYGRKDELESDRWAVELMTYAGFHPEQMLTVMDILEQASGGAGGGPEFMSTHPKPANRREYIRGIIAELFPDGIPSDLTRGANLHGGTGGIQVERESGTQ